jgi:hypothetical protein
MTEFADARIVHALGNVSRRSMASNVGANTGVVSRQLFTLMLTLVRGNDDSVGANLACLALENR